MNVVDTKHANASKVEQKQRFERLLLIWLRSIHLLKRLTNFVNAINVEQVCKDGRVTHKINTAIIPLLFAVVGIVNLKHADINEAGNLCQNPLKVLKKWRIVQLPNVHCIIVPVTHRHIPS